MYLIVKKSTFMKKWVPLTTVKMVRGALKGERGRLKSPHQHAGHFNVL